MADVFVSYAREDQKTAQAVAEQLAEAGFTTWWDSELLPHNRFATTIEEEIRAASAVIVIWSAKAAASPWVRAEAELARGRDKLIQVVVDHSEIPLPFNQYQAADLSNWRGDPVDPRWRKVLASVTHFTAKGPADGPAGPQAQRARKKVGWGHLRLSRSKLALAGAGVFALAVGGSALLWTYGTHDSRGARIAIQPFRTIGSAAALRDFAAGVSDSLQTVLTQDQLQILSPAEAQELNGDDVPGEARKLGVGLMFSGTVQPKGSDIDVSMRIDDPVQRATLWAAEMSGPAAKSDQLQARVGALTVAVLNCSQQVLGPRVGLTDTALQAFLHACELSETASHGSAGGSATYAMLDAMREAARQAPDFAGSHSMLAKHLAYVSPNIPGLRDEAEREAHRALQLDPKDPDALVALGLLRPQLDYAGREFWFRKALASNPAWSHANGFLGNVMSEVGRLQEALELYQRAASVNPLAADWTVVVPLALVQVGQPAAADREIGRIEALWPDNPLLWYWQYDSLVAQKRWGDALKFLDTANKLPSPPSPAWLTARRQLLAALQSRDVAARMTLRQQLVSANSEDARNTIYQLVLLGFVDDAFAVAAHYSPAPTDSPEILFNSELAPLRADPRFMALANRFRLVDYWQHSGHWPDFCSQPGLPYSCAQEAAKLRAAVR